MYGVRHGGWNEQQQANAYPQMQQHGESYQRSQQSPYRGRPNTFGHRNGRHLENPGFALPLQGLSQGPVVRNPWEIVVCGPSPYPGYDPSKMHPGYYKSTARQPHHSGPYTQIDTTNKVRSDCSQTGISIQETNIQARNYLQPHVISGDERLDAIEGQSTQNRSSMMHRTDTIIPSHLQQPRLDYKYSTTHGAMQHQYSTYPHGQYTDGRSQIPLHRDKSALSPSIQFQNAYLSPPNMLHGRQNQYPDHAFRPMMLSPGTKSSSRGSTIQDPNSTVRAISSGGMRNLPQQQDGNPSTHDASAAQMAPSLPTPHQQTSMVSATPASKASICTDLPGNFNLDCLLDNSIGLSGSFMQQLEDVVLDPLSSNTNVTLSKTNIMNQQNMSSLHMMNSWGQRGHYDSQARSLPSTDTSHTLTQTNFYQQACDRRSSDAAIGAMPGQLLRCFPQTAVPPGKPVMMQNDQTSVPPVACYQPRKILQSPPPQGFATSIGQDSNVNQNMPRPQHLIATRSHIVPHIRPAYCESSQHSARLIGNLSISHQQVKNAAQSPKLVSHAGMLPLTRPPAPNLARSFQHSGYTMSHPPQPYPSPQRLELQRTGHPSFKRPIHEASHPPCPHLGQTGQSKPSTNQSSPNMGKTPRQGTTATSVFTPVSVLTPPHSMASASSVQQQSVQVTTCMKKPLVQISTLKQRSHERPAASRILTDETVKRNNAVEKEQQQNKELADAPPDSGQAENLKPHLMPKSSPMPDISKNDFQFPTESDSNFAPEARANVSQVEKLTEQVDPGKFTDGFLTNHLAENVRHVIVTQQEMKQDGAVASEIAISSNETPNAESGESILGEITERLSPMHPDTPVKSSRQLTTILPAQKNKQLAEPLMATAQKLDAAKLPLSTIHGLHAVTCSHSGIQGLQCQELDPLHCSQRSLLGPGPHYHSHNVLQSPRHTVAMLAPQSFSQEPQPRIAPRQNIYPQPQQSMSIQGSLRFPQRYPQPEGEGCFPHTSYCRPHNYSSACGPQNCTETYYQCSDYGMQGSGHMITDRQQHMPEQFRMSLPGQVRSYSYTAGGNLPSDWHGQLHQMNVSDGMHTQVGSGGIQDLTQREETIKKSKAFDKDGTGSMKPRKERLKKHTDKKVTHDPDIIGDGSKEVPAISGKSEKKRRRPPATFKMKRKRCTKGDEADEYDVMLPAVDSSLVEKRRSTRNIKRTQYTENFVDQLSDKMSESELETADPIKAQHAELKHADHQMIVQRILDMRTRNVKKSCDNIEKTNDADAKREQQGLPGECGNLVQTSKNKVHENGGESDEVINDPTLEGEKSTEDQESTQQKANLKKLSRDEETRRKMFDFEEVEEYFVKYKNYSYLHCEWKTREQFQDKRVDGKIKRYKSKMAAMPEYLKVDLSEPFNPDYVEVERVLDVTQNEKTGNTVEKHFFVKWCSLPYEESTWEKKSDIPLAKIKEFQERCNYRPPENPPMVPHKNTFTKLTPRDAIFLDNNELRDYQLEGVNWLLFNWYNRRNCILADEMGLGKTVQSIAFLQKIFDHGIKGPFLIVAPLSTICNWQREFASWTDMNAIIYHGSQTSRDMIQTYEFFCRDENLDELPGQYKFHVVITTYEMIVLESSHLQDIEWECSIIDEAHRLKNQTCKLAEFLRSMDLNYKVLLTGTPLQNNVEELFALLSFLQPEIFNSTEAFITEFGDIKNSSQVEKLQELLKPMMLRRLKEDVEKSLAPKEETIIEVELTAIQKKYYRAIMEKNFEFLSKGALSGNIPNLMNTMMELRKCCNHPYLIKGAEDKILSEQENEESSLQLIIQSSGKLVLIDKLLPRLKSGGHRVLIFSQMVRCLDILEDYLVQKKYSYERIDGGIRGSERQAAIDRFSRPDSERFVFLLCTRAGGLGINLTAADTVIIFDSDWNPQNDLQAQARCHRIGQTKTVKIYRLITRNSYEREMFDKASLKLGLDKAVLQSISGRQDDISQNTQPALSKQEVENLLKLGAYGAIMDEDDDSKKFCEEDIDQILLRRTQTITIAPGQKGSTFSKASFVSGQEGAEISLNDPDFWEKWAIKADIDLDRLKNNKLIIEEPRRRKQTRRFGGMTQGSEVFAEIGSDSDSDYDEKSQSHSKNKSRVRSWGKKDYFRVEKNLLTFGWGRWKHMLAKGAFPRQMRLKELENVCRAILMYCLKFYNGDEKIKIFMWNLITPANCSAVRVNSSLEVSKGRKGRSIKEEACVNYDEIAQEWMKEVDVNTLLQEESFKKHLQHHCIKVLLRIRLLYFLKTEILGSLAGDINNVTAENFELNFPDIIPENMLPGWDLECDKNLLLGVHKHGFGKYSFMRADPKLCFLQKYGMPDDKSLADDLDDLAEDDNKDPEYKPAKLNLNEYSEFEDSPASTTPGTTPASPASSNDSTRETIKETMADEIKKGFKLTEDLCAEKQNPGMDDIKKEKDGQNERGKVGKSFALLWPSASELNMRVRRIVSCYQKQHKQIRSRLMNLDQNCPKSKLREFPRERGHWTRREEADFYRTVSTFGVEFTKNGFSWLRFRHLAKLDKKSDRSLEMYYLAFKAMCERACGHKASLPEEIAIIPVTKITEERASRTLYRIELLNRIRLDVLSHKKLDEHLKKCERSLDLPAWWKPGHHDRELLIGMDRHGVTRTEIHILNDTSLSFFKSMVEYEQSQLSKKRRKRNHSQEPTCSPAAKEMMVDHPSEIKDDNARKDGEKTELIGSSDLTFKEADSLFQNHVYNTQKWPKDRILIQRIEHVCYCVIHGKWPVARMQDEIHHVKPPLKDGETTAGDRKLLLNAEGHLMDEASSKILSLLAAQSNFKDDIRNKFKPKKSSRGEILQSPKLSSLKKDENTDSAEVSPHSDALLNLCLSHSKFNETLQTLLTADLSRMNSPQKTLLTEAIGLSVHQNEPLPKRAKEESSPPVTSEKIVQQSIFGSSFLKKKEEKGIIKKKNQKSKTGFISPAVLPHHSRIPVYNPTEKVKLIGDDAPLNKDLADWLKQHPGFVVDYKSLRQQLNEETRSPLKSPSSGIPSLSTESKLLKPAKTVSEIHHEKNRKKESTQEEKVESDPIPEDLKQQVISEQELQQLLNSHQVKLLNQSLINPSAGIPNTFYGNTTDMAALIASGMIPRFPSFLADPAKDQLFHRSSSSSSSSAQSKQSKNYGHSNERFTPQICDMASLFGLSNIQNSADMAALAMLLGSYPVPANKEIQKQLKHLLGQPSAPFDPKSLPLSGLSMPPFLPGMPTGMNPFVYGMYANHGMTAVPDLFHPAHMETFLESEHPKLEGGNGLNVLQDLITAQNCLMTNLVFDINNKEISKFVQTHEALQHPMVITSRHVIISKKTPPLVKTSSSGQTSDFDDGLRSVYQQLHASSMQKELHESRKKERGNRQARDRKASPSNDENPIDLRRRNPTAKKKTS